MNRIPPNHLSIELLSLGMTHALNAARAASEVKEVPIGAAIISSVDHTIIATASNEVEARQDPSAHAEILAIRCASSAKKNWRLTDTILFVTAEPCTMCAGCILLARIPVVVFGCAEPSIGAVGSCYDLLTSRGVRVIRHIQEEDCRALLTAFFQSLRGDPL